MLYALPVADDTQTTIEMHDHAFWHDAKYSTISMHIHMFIWRLLEESHGACYMKLSSDPVLRTESGIISGSGHPGLATIFAPDGVTGCDIIS